MSKRILLIAIVPLLILLISCENSNKSDQPPSPRQLESAQPISKEKIAVLSEVRKSLNQPGRAHAVVSAEGNVLKVVKNKSKIKYSLRGFVIIQEKKGMKRISDVGFETLVLVGLSEFGSGHLVSSEFSISKLLVELEEMGYDDEKGYEGIGTDIHLIKPPY